jgi:hypothetical protein
VESGKPPLASVAPACNRRSAVDARRLVSSWVPGRSWAYACAQPVQKAEHRLSARNDSQAQSNGDARDERGACGEPHNAAQGETDSAVAVLEERGAETTTP